MQIIIVAAKSENNVIGKENDLVWNLPADWAFFLSTIEGAYLITGRKSYESAPGETVFGKNRQFAILTKNKNYSAPYGDIASSLKEAINIAKEKKAKRVCILGGVAIYQQAMDIAHKMMLTEVHEHFSGDAFFPLIDLTKWKETKRVTHKKDKENPYDYSFIEYDRISR